MTRLRAGGRADAHLGSFRGRIPRLSGGTGVRTTYATPAGRGLDGLLGACAGIAYPPVAGPDDLQPSRSRREPRLAGTLDGTRSALEPPHRRTSVEDRQPVAGGDTLGSGRGRAPGRHCSRPEKPVTWRQLISPGMPPDTDKAPSETKESRADARCRNVFLRETSSRRL